MNPRRPAFQRSVLLIVLIGVIGCASDAPEDDPPPLQLAPTLTSQVSGDSALFIGISPVDENAVWISGTGGIFGRTLDGGTTWQTGVVPGADSLQFRDVHAVDAATAYLLSIGNGEQSRIYKTTDGGATWTLQFTNPDPNSFFDCMDFWDPMNGLAFSDSFEGAFHIITTDDGGVTWNRVPPESLPPANPSEGSFAASGNCVVVHGDSTAWIGTGASPNTPARVLKTTDRGATWTVVETPITGGATSGITSVPFHDDQHGAVLGGDFTKPDEYSDNVAVTDDGGQTWTLAGRPKLSGSVYGAVYVPGAPTPTLVGVGPQGVDYSIDNGMTWTSLDTLSHWSVAFASPKAGWAIGPEGRVTKIKLFE